MVPDFSHSFVPFKGGINITHNFTQYYLMVSRSGNVGVICSYSWLCSRVVHMLPNHLQNIMRNKSFIRCTQNYCLKNIFIQVWQCGGQVLISTCSRVGHVFRKVSPYTWPGGVVKILNHNTLRTVHVWMDEYRDFFLKINPSKRKNNTQGPRLVPRL